MITKSKSNQLRQTKNHKQQKYNLQIDLGKPKIPIYKTCKRKSLEKLEDWSDAS